MARRRRSIWERIIRESSDTATVTVTIPRDLAEQLMGLLMSSLELEDPGEDEMGGMDDLGMGDEMGPMEPDADDMGGPPDGDEDDLPAFMDGGDDDAPGFSAGDDDDSEEDAPDDDDDGEDDDSDDDDDDEEEKPKKESSGPSYGRPSPRPATAFGEARQRPGARGRRW